MTDPLGNEITLAYDDANDRASVTKPGGISATYEYDQIGRLKRVIDGLGQATVYTYDAAIQSGEPEFVTVSGDKRLAFPIGRVHPGTKVLRLTLSR